VLEDGVMLKSEANLIVSKTAEWPEDRRAERDAFLERLRG
jgi:ATP phosphoribosyltransferase